MVREEASIIISCLRQPRTASGRGPGVARSVCPFQIWPGTGRHGGRPVLPVVPTPRDGVDGCQWALSEAQREGGWSCVIREREPVAGAASRRERRCPSRFGTGRLVGRRPEALICSAGGGQQGDGMMMARKCDTIPLVGSSEK